MVKLERNFKVQIIIIITNLLSDKPGFFKLKKINALSSRMLTEY